MGGRRTQQERRATTERALLAAAADLVVESGLHSMTLAGVGRRAGYSRGIVTHHFGSKQALIETLVATSRTGFVAGLDAHEPGLGHLLALLEGYLRAIAAAGTPSRAFVVLWAESVGSLELGPVFREHDAAFRDEVAGDVVAGQAAGEIRSSADPQVVAAVVVAELRGLAVQCLVAPDALDPAALGQALAQHWNDLLRPHSSPAPPS